MRLYLNRTVFLFSLFGLCVLGVPPLVKSQAILNHQTISMGGGTAYVTGPSANFTNPANLMIWDNRRRNQLIIAQGGFYLSEGMNIETFHNNFSDFEGYFTSGYTPGSYQSYPHSDILNHRFPGSQQLFSNVARFDIMPFGISFTRRNHSFSLALRSRGINAYELSRGWYDTVPHPSDHGVHLDRNLRQNLHSYHEISVGLAQEVTMVNGWMTGLNKLYFGIAPKFIMGSFFFEGNYTSGYYRQPDDEEYLFVRSYQSKAVNDIHRLQNTSTLNRAATLMGASQTKYQNLLDPTGYGLGVDMGFTFVIGLGDDNSLSPHTNIPMRKSLRFSVSMTDLGVISYNGNPTVTRTGTDSTRTANLPDQSRRHFSGYNGEFFDFITSVNGESIVIDELNGNNRMTEMLPTTVHFGSVLQYNRTLTTVDVLYNITPDLIGQRQWNASIGSELRILNFLPVRTGLSLNANYKPVIGLGLGIDTGFWELSVATRLKQGYDNNAYAIGVGLASMLLRF